MFPSPVTFYSPDFFYLALIWHDGHLLLVTSCHHSWFLSLEQTTRAYFFPITLRMEARTMRKGSFISTGGAPNVAREHQSLDMSSRHQL
jgi:hypothetical protein